MHPTVQPSTRTTSGRHVRNGRGRHAAESVDVIAGMRNHAKRLLADAVLFEQRPEPAPHAIARAGAGLAARLACADVRQGRCSCAEAPSHAKSMPFCFGALSQSLVLHAASTTFCSGAGLPVQSQPFSLSLATLIANPLMAARARPQAFVVCELVDVE